MPGKGNILTELYTCCRIYTVYIYILYYIMLIYTVIYYIIYVMLYYILFCFIILCYIILYYKYTQYIYIYWIYMAHLPQEPTKTAISMDCSKMFSSNISKSAMVNADCSIP